MGNGVKVRINRLDVMSVAKLTTVYFALAGLFMGIFQAVLLSTISRLSGSFVGIRGFGGLVGFVGFSAIILYPIIYAILGFIGGAISAALYNLVAKWVGGIQIEMEELNS